MSVMHSLSLPAASVHHLSPQQPLFLLRPQLLTLA